jgi:hypothetical protein
MDSFLRLIAPYVPGTDQWLAVRMRLFRIFVNRQLGRLDRLRKLHPATKAKLRRSVFRHSSALAKGAIPVEMFKHGVGTWTLLLLAIGLVANGPITASLLSFDYSLRFHWYGAWFHLFGIALLLLSLKLFLLAGEVAHRLWPSPDAAVAAIAFLSLSLAWPYAVYEAVAPQGGPIFRATLAYEGVQFDQITTGDRFTVASVTIGGALTVFEFWLAVLIGAALEGRREKTRRRHPDAALAIDLLSVLTRLRRAGPRPGDVRTRKAVLTSLESAAQTVQRDFPLVVRGGDAATDLWWADRSVKIAAALRDFKKHILNPAERSWEQVADQVRSMLVHAATGEWGRLPVAASEPLKSPGLGKKLFNIARAIFVAGFPLGVLWLLRVIHLEPEPPFFEWFKLAAILWAIISLLTAMDSETGSRLALIRDLLPFGGKGKKD